MKTAKETLRAAAAAMGRKGGNARARKLTPDRMREIGRMGGLAAKANRDKAMPQPLPKHIVVG